MMQKKEIKQTKPAKEVKGAKPKRAKRTGSLIQKPMETQVHQLQMWANGDIFTVNQGIWISGGDPNNDTFTLRVYNSSGDWVAVDVDRANNGTAHTGHIENGDHGGYTEAYNLYQDLNYWPSGEEIKITRWRPGAFGIPGNGGGELWAALPVQGTVIIDINVIG